MFVESDVIPSFIKFQVLGALGGQDVHCASSITDGSTPPLVGIDHMLPWESSIHLYLGECWLWIPSKMSQSTVGGVDVKPCVGEHV